jgi:glycosyltransferase involved in cell wall biosynthesis
LKYLIVNPYYNETNGIENAIRNTLAALDGKLDVELFANTKNLNKKQFQKAVYNYVTSNFGTEEVIIEAPEARASTILLPKSYNVHIRLHCPLAVAQKYDGFNPDESIYSEELRVIHKAKVVSSPSYGLLKEMENEIEPDNVFVYKNQYNKNIKMYSSDQKEYDVVFMGRFQKLKGIEYLNPILERLPENYRVLLFGKNSSKFKFSKNIKCSITVKEHIANEERFDLVGKAKTLIMLSRFENCSMVILESLAAGTVVTCWDVGGNSEIAPPKVMQVVPFEDIEKLVSEVIKICETKNYPSKEEFVKALTNIDKDFTSGTKSVVDYLLSLGKSGQNSKIVNVFKGINCSDHHQFDYNVESKTQNSNELENPFGKRVLGFTISNEHIEEMWVPVVKKLGLEARYVCRRPLGFHTVFNNPFPVEKKEFAQYDWIENPTKLIKNINNFKPNKLLFHNGLHPMYQDVLDEVKKLGIPIIYSELGWFPQKDHVYFDRWGTNGKSYLASLSAEAFCRKSINDKGVKRKKVKGDHVLVVTQLENDTNLIVNSPLFKKNQSFIKHIIQEIPKNEKIIIKVHPLDKHWEKLREFENDRVKVIKEGNLEELLANSKAVVGINSTVLIQALEYDINIYSYGYSLLDNKGVAISCLDAPLSTKWNEYLVGSRKRRNMLIEGFKSRQINIRQLENLSTESLVDNIAFEPFLYANQEDFSKLDAYIKKMAEKNDSLKLKEKAKAQQNKNEANNTKKIKPDTKKSEVQSKALGTKKVEKNKLEENKGKAQNKKKDQQNLNKNKDSGKVAISKPAQKKTFKQLWIRRFKKFRKDPKIVFTFLAKKFGNKSKIPSKN